MSSGSGPGISATALLAELRTQGIGRALRVLAEATSTVDIARDWLHNGAPDGAVVLAAHQTHGRGRRGRSWASPAGGLWMTIILRRDLEPEAAARLSIGLALAAAEVVSGQAGCEVGVKWPNDLVLDGRKLGGVLVDAELVGERVASALVSLGLNVNVPETAFPPELRGSGVSLLSATGKEYPLARLAARLLESFEALLPAMIEDPDALIEVWHSRDVLLGREVSVDLAGETIRGRARGIDRQGRLLLSTLWHRQTAISAGQVTSVSMAGAMTVRKLRLTDLPRVLQIERSSFGQESSSPSTFLAHLFRDRRHSFVVEDEQGMVVGYTLVRMNLGWLGMKRGGLTSIAVDPVCRRQGIGRVLMAEALRSLRERAVEEADLEVSATNRAAQSLYEAFGFRRTQLLPHYYSSQADGIRMVLDLRPKERPTERPDTSRPGQPEQARDG